MPQTPGEIDLLGRVYSRRGPYRCPDRTVRAVRESTSAMRSRIWQYALGWVLMAAIFAAEYRHLLAGTTAHLLYVAVVLLELWTPGRATRLQTAVASTVLMIAGQTLNPPDGDVIAGRLTFGVSLVV